MAKITLITENQAFGEAVAGLAAEYLSLECGVSAGGDIADSPYFILPNPPVRLDVVLDAILAHAKKPTTIHDVIEIGHGVKFNARIKTLQYADKKDEMLTDKEAALLTALLAQRSISREDLLKEVWGVSAEMDTHTVETHIYRLRNKLKNLLDAPWILATDSGYTLEI